MRYTIFASRNAKEILRDPATALSGVGMPLLMLGLFTLIQSHLPLELYTLPSLTPGIAVFSFSFLSLFSALLIAKDRSSSFLMRLFASPLTATDYIVGYTLPLLPIAILQGIVCFVMALVLGLPANLNILLTIVVFVPIAVLYIGCGLLFGTLFTDKQVGGAFSIFVNVTTWLSGTWFALDLMGGTLRKIGYALPFAHAVDASRAALAGDYAAIMPHLWWVLGYAVTICAVAVLAFRRRMVNGAA